MSERGSESERRPPEPTAGKEKAGESSTEGHWLLAGKRPVVAVLLLGCLFYLPWLGKSGLWDPWEPHYAEVAREMVEGGNWLEPTWEWSPGQSRYRKHFFSKPILILWMMAVPMKLFGVHAPSGGIEQGSEFWIRLPFALCAVLGMLGVFLIGRCIFGVREGLLAAVILGSCPQYYFVARQAMTDMPMLGLMTLGVALVLTSALDDGSGPAKLYAGWALLGLAALAKGLLPLVLPALVLVTYLLLTRDWNLASRMRIPSGAAVTLAVAMPWYLYISIASAVKGLVDDEGKTFFQRFFLHDHLYRLAKGVHGDRGTFAYFVKELGIGMHPWAPFAAWAAVRTASAMDERKSATSPELLIWLWLFGGFVLFSLSMTKFHHYAMPVLPAGALLAARWLCAAERGEEKAGRIVGLMLVLGVILISRDIALAPKELVDLFVYNYTRPFPAEQAVAGQVVYAIIFGLACVVLAAGYLFRLESLPRLALPSLTIAAVVSALWGGWFFFNSMGPHWSQRHLFDTYYALKGPDDPIGAYLMNWRGETFYSRNAVVQLKSSTALRRWLSENRTRRRFVIVERHRLGKLKKQLTSSEMRTLKILDRSCNKFYLVSVDPTGSSPPKHAPPPKNDRK